MFRQICQYRTVRRCWLLRSTLLTYTPHVAPNTHSVPRRELYLSTTYRIKHGVQSKNGKVNSDKNKNGEVYSDKNKNGEAPKSLGIMERFKNAYKEYGKTLIAVHIVTSCVWGASFYFAAVSGIDIIPWLEKLGASETVIKPFRNSGVGDVAIAYLLYKLATPARYAVTIIGTQQTAKYLKKLGYIKPPPKGDTIKELSKEMSDHVKKRLRHRRDKVMHTVRTRTKHRQQKLKDSYYKYRNKSSSSFMYQRKKRKS